MTADLDPRTPDSSSGGEGARDGHRHLSVVASAPPAPKASRLHRWLVVGLAVLAVLLFVASYFRPYWSFVLYAPQYPFGLKLVISLSGVTGDVREIDTINHYIGMGHLADAATFERDMAAFGIGAVGAMVVALALVTGKKVGRLTLLPGLALPVLFVADTFYWMWKFGHDLDPKAPIRIPPFTPALAGNGQIGQFLTFAQPGQGFWLAVAGVVVLAGAVVLRGRVCKVCPQAGTCGVVCPRAFLLPERPPKVAP